MVVTDGRDKMHFEVMLSTIFDIGSARGKDERTRARQLLIVQNDVEFL